MLYKKINKIKQKTKKTTKKGNYPTDKRCEEDVFQMD